MLSWSISVCISNTVSSHLHYYSRSKTALCKNLKSLRRRGGEYPTIALIGCCGYVNHFTTFFFLQSESVLQMVKWVCGTKHTEYFPPGGRSNSPKGCFFPSHCSSVTTCIAAEDSFGFTFKSNKMTHFNKGPAYGLSAEVRSKVSAPAPSAPFVSRRKNILQTRSKLAKV